MAHLDPGRKLIVNRDACTLVVEQVIFFQLTPPKKALPLEPINYCEHRCSAYTLNP
jgi:hypothetical protein